MFRKVHIVELGPANGQRKLAGDEPKSGDKHQPANASRSPLKVTNLNNPGKLGQLAWSPDGKKLAMITGADKHDPKEGQVWIHPSSTSDWTKVSVASNAHVESMVWSDPTHIMFLRSIGVGSSMDGAAFHDDKKGESTVQWIPFGDGHWRASANLSASSKGDSYAYVVHTPGHPPEVYWRGTDIHGPRRLTDSNPWLKDMKFAKQEVIKYNAKDGLELEGILIRPLNEEKGKRYPLILNVMAAPNRITPTVGSRTTTLTRPGRGRQGDGRLLSQLSRQHRLRRRVLHEGPKGRRRQGIRRPH